MLKFTKVLKPLSTIPKFSLINWQAHTFCTNDTKEKQKTYIMPQIKDTKRIYFSNRKVTFKNGRYLIYLNKQNLSTPFLLGLHYTIPLTYIAYLIYTNPFYLTFPAALPIMFIVQTILLLNWIEHKSHFKRQVERVYLLSNGSQIEIVYANKIRRYVKNNPEHTFHTTRLFQNRFEQDLKNNRIKRYKGTRFPPNPDAPFSEAMQPFLLDYGWTVRDQQFNDYVIPAKFEYADWEFLSKVMNGIPVICSNAIYEGEFNEDKYPTIEEQQNNIKLLKQGIIQTTKDNTENIKTGNQQQLKKTKN